MDSSSEDISETFTSTQMAQISCINLLPTKSKKKYQNAYKNFLDWRKDQQISSFSETILLTYFEELSKKFKSSTLWSQFSMLKAMLTINENLDISNYNKLKLFLKRQSDGYKPKKSSIFASKEIKKFIEEAPDNQFLMTKVACIMGVMGSCRRQDLYNMKTTNITDTGSMMLITLPDTKTKTTRKFAITRPYYEIIKQYTNLRPPHTNENHFFLNYQKGKCSIQKVGINKFGSMGKQIATFLKLPNPEMFTGHCFRRTSATILVDADADEEYIARHSNPFKIK